MQNGGAPEIGTASKEIRFACPHCSAPLVIDAGSTVKLLDCKRCKKSVRVPRTATSVVTPPPKVAAAAAASPKAASLPKVQSPPAKAPTAAPPPVTAAPPIVTAETEPPPLPDHGSDTLADLQRQLKENQSQRTEITGYINQLNIQLHRWQLRIKSLNERQKELESRIAAAEVKSRN